MKDPKLIRLTVEIAAPAEEAVVELFKRVFDRIPSIYVDEASGRVGVSMFFRSRRECSEKRRKQVKEGLGWITACGLETGPGRIRLARVKREDWAESWKRHFPVLEIGDILLVKPTWSRRNPDADQVAVTLDPGLSFGTGHHPTTQFCLEQLVAHRPRSSGEPRAFLDIGTGSGILAIAAVKLGYRPVEAFDFDPDAVRVAKENSELNGVQRLIRIARRDLRAWKPANPRRFDVICANLTDNLLLECRETILDHLAPWGSLVLAGILRSQFSRVQAAYGKVGWRVQRRRRVGEWESGWFTCRS